MKLKPILALSAILSLAAFAAPGGWATVTLDPLPERIVVNEAIPFSFVVKQHGKSPLAGLTPRIEAVAKGQKTVEVTATAAEKEKGRYVASVRLPAATEWKVTIHSGFMNSRLELEPLNVAPRQVSQSTARPER